MRIVVACGIVLGAVALLQPAAVALVYLDSPREQLPARSHHGATEFMQPCPGGLIFLQTEHSLPSQRAGAVLLSGHPPHRAEPDRQRSPRVLEDRSCCH